MSHSEIDVYRRIISRWDIYAKQDTKANNEGKYGYPKRISPLRDELLQKSIDTDILTIGTYCVDPQSQKTKNPTADIDAHHGENHVQEKATAIYQTLVECGASPYVEATAGKIEMGARVGIITNWKADELREFFTRVLEFNGLIGEVEVFPKQDEASLKNPGSLVKLPFQFNNRTKTRSEIVDPVTFETLSREAGIKFMMDLPETNMQFVKFPGEDSLFKLDRKPHKPAGGCLNSNRMYYDDIPKAENFDEVLSELRLCFRENYKNKTETIGGHGWAWMSSCAAEILANGGTEEHVHQYFSVQKQYNKATTKKHLAPIKRRGLMPYRCATLQDQCSKYVETICPQCDIIKKKKLHENLDETVDKTQGKEKRKDTSNGETRYEDSIQGRIDTKNEEARQILAQFEAVAGEARDILSGETDLLLTNAFNSGKSWLALTLIKEIVPKERVNYIVPSLEVKQQTINRMKKCEIPFLDNPSSMELCSRVEELEADGLDIKKLGYIPSLICRKCELSGDMNSRELTEAMRKEYLEYIQKENFYGDTALFKEWGKNFNICPRRAYLGLLLGVGVTNKEDSTAKPKKSHILDEELVLIMTDLKASWHFFIPDSPLINALNAHINVIDAFDFVDRSVPKRAISAKEVKKACVYLGLPDDIDALSILEPALKEIIDKLLSEDTPLSMNGSEMIDNKLRETDTQKKHRTAAEKRVRAEIEKTAKGGYTKYLECISLVQLWIFLEKHFKDGIFRKIRTLGDDNHFTYDVMSDRPLKFVYNDILLETHDPKLLEDEVKYFKNQVISPHPIDGVVYGPLKFSSVLKLRSRALHTLGMTATPTDLELLDGSWKKQFEGNDLEWIGDIYGVSRGMGTRRIAVPENTRLVHSRKVDGEEYINDGKTRGNSGTKDDSRPVVVDRHQYPREFLDYLWYMAQLANGDMRTGNIIGYQELVAQAVTAGQKGTPVKTHLPRIKLVKDLGIPVNEDEKDAETIYQRLAKVFKRDGYIYPSDGRPSTRKKHIEDLDYLVSQGYLIKSGKKYIPSKLLSDRV